MNAHGTNVCVWQNVKAMQVEICGIIAKISEDSWWISISFFSSLIHVRCFLRGILKYISFWNLHIYLIQLTNLLINQHFASTNHQILHCFLKLYANIGNLYNKIKLCLSVALFPTTNNETVTQIVRNVT